MLPKNPLTAFLFFFSLSFTPPLIWLFQLYKVFVQNNLYLSGEWFVKCHCQVTSFVNCQVLSIVKLSTLVYIGIEEHHSICQNQKVKPGNGDTYPHIISFLSPFFSFSCFALPDVLAFAITAGPFFFKICDKFWTNGLHWQNCLHYIILHFQGW